MNPPTISAALVSFFHTTFLSHTPQRHARMLRPGATQKYHEDPTPITDAQLQQHLAGEITLAAPAAHADLGCVLPLDVDQGGLPAIQALLHAATAAGLWAFGQYTPRREWTPQRQRGYVWVVVDGLVNIERLALLGQQLVRDAGLPAHHIEIRAHHAVTRLPLGRHTHTRRFGQLVLPGGVQLDIDANPAAALQALQRELQRNPVALLPEAPAAPPSEFSPRQLTSRDVIQQFNAQADIRAMVVQYGGRRSSSTLYHCFCGQHDNGDKTPSLGISQARNPRYGRWMLKGFAPSCVFHTATDAFGLYCRMEQLSAKEAVKQIAHELGLDQAPPEQPRPRASSTPEDHRRRSCNPPATPPEPPADLSARLRLAAWMRLAQDGDLAPASRRIMGTLLTEMDTHGSTWCRPSVPSLMSITGYSRRSVQTALRSLEQTQYIQTDFAGNAGHGGDETNVYHLWTSGGMSSTAPAEALSVAEGGRNGSAPKVKHVHDSQLKLQTLKPGRGHTPNRAPDTPVQPDRKIPQTKKMQGTPPKAALLPAPHPNDTDSLQTGQPATNPRLGKPSQSEAIPLSEGATFTPVPVPTNRRPASPGRSQRWLYDLGNDLDTLRQAEATARREAKYHFVQRQPTAGRRRMWEAGQIRDRIALLERLPQRPTTPRPAAQLTLEQAANVARLRELGIYPANAERYGRLPAATIDQAEALARSIGGDQARLVTSFLKRHATEGWRIPQPVGADSGLLDERTYTGSGAFAAYFIRDEGNVAAEWAAWAARQGADV